MITYLDIKTGFEIKKRIRDLTPINSFYIYHPTTGVDNQQYRLNILIGLPLFSESVLRDQVNAIVSQYANSESKIIILSILGQKSICPVCRNHFTSSATAKHFKTHVNDIQEINLAKYIILRESLEKKANQLRILIKDYSIDSLYQSASGTEKKRINRDLYNKFIHFEQLVLGIPEIDFKDSEYIIFIEAKKKQAVIRDALSSKIITLLNEPQRKKKHRNKKSKRLKIYQGGAPGLGKRS